jgi:hypothetical protein
MISYHNACGWFLDDLPIQLENKLGFLRLSVVRKKEQ